MLSEINDTMIIVSIKIEDRFIKLVIWHLSPHQLLYFAFVGVNIHLQSRECHANL